MDRINLLPSAERAKASRERGVAFVALGLIVLIGVLGLLYVLRNNQVADKENRLSSVTADVTTTNNAATELEPFAALQTVRTEMKQTAGGVVDSRIDFSSILSEISLVVPDDVEFKDISFAVPNEMRSGGGFGSTTASLETSPPDITLVGIAGGGHRTVAELVVRLGLIPQLTNVRLASSTMTAAQQVPGQATVEATYDFSITANLRPFLTPPPFGALQAVVKPSPPADGGAP